jgi:DNA replication protein DnaC
MYQHEPTAEDIRENEEKRKINGYAPNPYCIKCHGFGRVYPWKENGQLDTSRTIPCTAPNCLADAIKVWKESGAYLELKGISSRFQTFEEFTPKLGTEKSLAAFRDLATNPDTKPFLLVYGGVGNGKTHLCQALTKELIKRGVSDAHYYRVSDLLKTLRSAIQDHTLDDWITSLSKIGALILDDYGLEAQTDWALANIEDIVDARWQEKRITVMTTNKDIKELPSRIASRFSDTELSVKVLNTGADYRKMKKEN